MPKTPETYRYTTEFSCLFNPFIERRLSAPGLGGAGLSPGENSSGGELSFLAAETRSLMRAGDTVNGQQPANARLHGASSRRLLIGHPSSASGPMGGETGFPLASRPHMRGPAGGQMAAAAHYRRFQDSSFSSFRHSTQSLTQ
jgi:hypothetical protein